VIGRWLFKALTTCLLLYSCRADHLGGPTPGLHPPGTSKFTGVGVYTYIDTMESLVLFSNQALLNEASARSMIFTGSGQALSYAEASSLPNTLWADTLEADLDNNRLNASGQCLLVTVEGDSFETSQIFFANDSLSSFGPTRAVFSPRSERNIVLEPGEHLLDSFVYRASKTLLWKR